MPSYRARPNTIEARIYDPHSDHAHAMDVIEWCAAVECDNDGEGYAIPTAFGYQWIDPGDYIIQEAFGDFRAVKPDIFQATYESVDRPALLADRLTGWARRQKA